MIDPNLLQPPPVIVDVTQPSASPGAPPPDWKTKVWGFVRKYVLAPVPVLIIVAVAFVLAMLGVKNLQVGGLIGKILGRRAPENKAIEVANSIPPGRVREDGSIINIGEPDSKGLTQAQVVAIKEPGLFDDPKVIKVTPPGETKPISIQVPDGVKAHDIETVVVIKPEVMAVTVKSTSKIKAEDVDDLLKKYKR
jgi:hypothetical protein